MLNLIHYLYPENNTPLLESYSKQLCLYAYIIKERYSKPVEKMYIYWTAEEKRKDALMELKYSFDKVVQSIMAKDFTVKNSPSIEKVCKECDFRFCCSTNDIIILKTKELMEG